MKNSKDSKNFKVKFAGCTSMEFPKIEQAIDIAIHLMYTFAGESQIIIVNDVDEEIAWL